MIIHLDHYYKVNIDVDSVIGISRKCPFVGAFPLLAAPRLSRKLDSSIHIKHTITHNGRVSILLKSWFDSVRMPL